MPTIPIPGGFTNKEAIDHAYTALGLSDSMFGRTAEEYASGQLFLRAMMGEWPFDQLGYDDVETGLTAESGVDRKWLNTVGLSLAQLLGTAIGKVLPPTFNALRARSYTRLCGAVADTPEMSLAPGTITGAGAKRGPTFVPGTD